MRIFEAKQCKIKLKFNSPLKFTSCQYLGDRQKATEPNRCMCPTVVSHVVIVDGGQKKWCSVREAKELVKFNVKHLAFDEQVPFLCNTRNKREREKVHSWLAPFTGRNKRDTDVFCEGRQRTCFG